MAGISVIIYEKNRLLTARLKNLLQIDNDVFYETATKQELRNVLFKTEGGSRVIVADTDGERDGGLFFLGELKEKTGDSPVIVLSSNGSRRFFIDSIKLGAADFILKPFEDKALLDKMENFLSVRKCENAVELVTFNFARYLSGEIRKAQKGKYDVSLMFATYLRKDGIETEDQKSIIDRYIFDNLQSIFWDTDVFVRFGKKYFIGVFPFCSVKNTKVLSDKIQGRFGEMKRSFPKLSQYELADVFSTYPDDAQDAGLLSWMLIKKASVRVKEEISLVL